MSAPFDLETTDALLTTTRSVRRRLDLSKPVEREVILDCLRIAQQAPTGSNIQLARWVVVTDAEKRRALADLYASGQPMIDRSRAAMPKDDRQTQRVYESVEYLMPHFHEVPVMVIPCVTALRTPDMDACTLSSISTGIRSRRRPQQSRLCPALRNHGPLVHRPGGVQLLGAGYREHGGTGALWEPAKRKRRAG